MGGGVKPAPAPAMGGAKMSVMDGLDDLEGL